MDAAKLQTIHIPEGRRRRSHAAFWTIAFVVGGLTAAALVVANPWGKDKRDIAKQSPAAASSSEASEKTAPAELPKTPTPAKPAAEAKPGDVVLTVSGYIINRERIEISPRVMNQVKWIGVKKGDTVKKDQVIVRLDDAEQRANLADLDGQIALAKVSLEKAKVNYQRVKKLRATQNETAEHEDEARLSVDAAEAQIQQLEGVRQKMQVWLDWTVIKSPIDGVILDKLADPGELVSPQSFGGTGGPSTALVSMADPNDLQVEIDVSERDLPKIFPNQRCRVTPEAYPNHPPYGGHVAEIAPEANRQKGTLQVKVQIEKPDHFLTPELNAKVEFLKGDDAEPPAADGKR